MLAMQPSSCFLCEPGDSGQRRLRAYLGYQPRAWPGVSMLHWPGPRGCAASIILSGSWGITNGGIRPLTTPNSRAPRPPCGLTFPRNDLVFGSFFGEFWSPALARTSASRCPRDADLEKRTDAIIDTAAPSRVTGQQWLTECQRQRVALLSWCDLTRSEGRSSGTHFPASEVQQLGDDDHNETWRDFPSSFQPFQRPSLSEVGQGY
jgi:hypothetical protein